MKNIKIVCLLICLFTFGYQTMAQLTMNELKHAHTTKLENAKKYTNSTIDAFNEVQLNFKPTEEEMTVMQQTAHLCQNIFWLSSLIAENKILPVKINKDKTYTKIELLDFINQSYDFAIKTIQEVAEDSIFNTAEIAGNKLNKIQLLNLIQDHQTHHRAQLLVYARLNGIKPPAYKGW
jgi:uncharacterized damage-inducible protein DinB